MENQCKKSLAKCKKNMLLHHFKEYSGILYRYEKIWMQRYSEKGYVHILHTVHSAAGVLYSAKEALTRIYIYIYRLQLLVESVDRPARRSDQARKWRWNTKHIVVWIENISNFDDDDDVRHPRHGGKIQPEQRKWHENWVEWNMTMNQSDRLGSGPWNAKHMNSLHEIKFNEHQERARSRRSDLATEKTKGRFGSFGCSWWKTKNAQFSCWSPRLVMPYFVRSGACENMHKWQVTRRTSGFRAPNIKKTRLGVTGGWRKRAWALVPQFPKHSRGSNRPCNDRPCRLSTFAEAGCQSMPDPMAGHADSKCIGNRGF